MTICKNCKHKIWQPVGYGTDKYAHAIEGGNGSEIVCGYIKLYSHKYCGCSKPQPKFVLKSGVKNEQNR